jgi:glucan phosphoethanolaminetransferase (alkaline phosphatase superfamily)
MRNQTIPLFFWLIVPILLILAQVGLELSFTREQLGPMHSENGPHELLQSLYIGFAFFLAVFMLFKIDWKTKKEIGLVVAIAALGSLYISGEEISWGQHILNWSTPEYWSNVNDQNETNLHNTSSWLDQKPRLLLFIGIVAAGLLVPFLRRVKPEWVPVRFAHFYPSDTLCVAALGVFLPYTIHEIGEHFFDVSVFARVSEVQEVYMYYFVSLYLWDLYKREIYKV